MIKEHIFSFLKGLAMGTANVIPGVSGGTIAFITGIFERIINVIKNLISIKSFKLLFSFKLKEWAKYVDFSFALSLGLGIIAALISVAKLLEYLFEYYPLFVWAFFFGLILASVYFVTLTIKKWSFITILFYLIGIAIAVSFVFMKPVNENSSLPYLLVCGAVAACSMILPGLSGSFVLVLMGNYELIMIRSIIDFDLSIIIPVAIGAGIGLGAFSYILSFIFKNYSNQTIALLSGFILGSLAIIWPWKHPVYKLTSTGEYLVSRSGKYIVESYNYYFPQNLNTETILAVVFIISGFIIVYLIESFSKKIKKE